MKIDRKTPSFMVSLGVTLCLLALSGCGALTGLPGHGGGKRFAVEQELVAAATRSAIKQIDLYPLRGKKVNLYVNAIGDTGTGQIIGGRFSLISQLRGDYAQSPVTTERSTFPHYRTTTSSQNATRTDGSTTTESSGTQNGTSSSTASEAGQSQSNTSTLAPPATTPTTSSTTGSSQTNTTTNGNNSATSTAESIQSTSSNSTSSGYSTTDSVLAMPETKKTQQKGSGGVAQLGVEYKGIGAYQNSMEITADDLKYLSALIQTYLFLQGVYIVPPSEAEIDVYVTVDVFGTIRTRVDWYLANNEILRAKTSLEIMAVEHLSGKLVMQPRVAAAEAEYNEQYILWAGPISIRKTLNRSEPLMSDFTDIIEGTLREPVTEKKEPIPYPFRHEIEKMGKKEPELGGIIE